MDIIATLILAHLLADFPLQTNSVALGKSKSLQGLLTHIYIYMATSWALLGFEHRFWLLIGCLGTAHFVVDYLKLKGNPSSVRLFILDQVVHLVFVITIGSSAASIYGPLQFGLSERLLYPSLWIATTLAIMVMFWLWANNLHEDTLKRYVPLRWGRERLLELEQRTGYGLICFLGIGVMLMR